MEYKNTAPPIGNDLEVLKNWIQAELSRVSAELGQVKQLNMNVRNPIPPRYGRGDIYYFDAGIVGLVEGPYFYDGTKWLPLGPYPPAGGTIYRNTSASMTVAMNVDTKVPVFDQASPYTVDVTLDTVNDTITINRDGLYRVQGGVNLINPAPNQLWSLVMYRNGVAAPITRTTVTGKDNNDGVQLSTIVVSTLVAGDVIDLRIRDATAGHTFTVNTAILSVVQQQ